MFWALLGSPVQLIKEVFRDCICRRRRHTVASLWGACLRFASLWRTNSRGDSCVLKLLLRSLFCLFVKLSHLISGYVSSAFIFQTFDEVCYSVFVNRSSFKSVLNLRKAYIFKSFLKVYYRSVFAESFKTFIFQKFRRPLCHKVNLPSCVARRPLCHKVNLPRCEARRRRFIMTCDIFGTGQTNILSLRYLFWKTYKQPIVAHLKSLKSTHSTKLLHLLGRTIRSH